jgi:hypothetical protein
MNQNMLRTILAFQIALLFAQFVSAEPLPTPEQAIVVDLHRPWLDGANWDNNTPPNVYGVDATLDTPRFSIVDPNAQSLWVYRFALPIDLTKYPTISLKYRAHGTNKDGEYVLRLVSEKDGSRNRFNAFKGSDLVADGQEHVLTQDLHEAGGDGNLTTFGIGFRSDAGAGTLELLDLRFTASGSPEKLKQDSPIKVRVTDMNDAPISGATVTLDAERANFAQSGKTDSSGDATVTPILNEQQKHMLRVEKVGYLTMEVPNAVSESGQELVVKTMPAVKYGGIAKDASGKPVANAQISIKFKPELLQELPMRFQTNIVTNEKGEWSSLPLPADASQLIVALTTRDSSDKPSVTQLDAATLKQGGTAVATATPTAAKSSPPDAPVVKKSAPAPKPAFEPITAIVQKIDDSTMTLAWSGAKEDHILGAIHPQADKSEAVDLPLADVSEIVLKRGGFSSPPSAPSTRPTNTLPNSRVTLADNDRLLGTIVGWSDKKLSIHPAIAMADKLEIPVSSLRELWCGTADQIKKAQALKEQAGLDDIAFAIKDDDVIAVHGIVIGIDDDSLHFRYDNADRKIGLSRLVGIVMAKNEESAGDDALFEQVQFVNDDQISGTLSSLEAKTLVMQSRAGTELRIPIDQITKIVTRNGRLTYLSDLKPTKVEQTPYFDRLMEYRLDKSLNGKPILLSDGTYAHGISVHSRCVLTYDLGGKYSEFRSKVGFQLPEGKIGDCAIRVLGDGKALFEKPDARGDQPPQDLKLAVAGIHELTLEVDYGRNDDVGDRVAWANARVIRAEK